MKHSSSYICSRFQIFFTSPSVTSFLRGAPPPKKNPGSAPAVVYFPDWQQLKILWCCKQFVAIVGGELGSSRDKFEGNICES